MSTTNTPSYLMPSDPRMFKAKFYTCYFDDNGEQQASSPYSHIVELDTKIKDGIMILEGTASLHKHQAYNLPLDNHDYGLSFSLVCRNRHKSINGQVFWRTYLSSRETREKMKKLKAAEKLTIVGDMMQVPHSPEFNAEITLRHIHGKGHVVSGVKFEIPVDFYYQFFDRIQN